jgi:ATP:corrinoid adenosyltransferase
MEITRLVPKEHKGLVVVITGYGKGKTTAALGIAVRACGHNMKVCMIQFMKGDKGGVEIIESPSTVDHRQKDRAYLGKQSRHTPQPDSHDKKAREYNGHIFPGNSPFS